MKETTSEKISGYIDSARMRTTAGATRRYLNRLSAHSEKVLSLGAAPIAGILRLIATLAIFYLSRLVGRNRHHCVTPANAGVQLGTVKQEVGFRLSPE